MSHLGVDIMILDTGSDLSVYQLSGEKTEEPNCSSCCGSKENNAARGGLEKSLRNYDINEYVGMYQASRTMKWHSSILRFLPNLCS